jgi:phosphopantothenoylcysteine decarboxylase/phosphopantothenate--cysteine ligase
MKTLTNKNIILGVCGSISAYKSPDIVRRLQDLGANVRVILTSGGAKFITPLALQVISQHKIYDNLWDDTAALSMGHIELAKWADAILVAPASANTLAHIASGSAPDLLNNVILASAAQLIVSPAMNQQMYSSKAVQANLSRINQQNGRIIPAQSGMQACGDVGIGRLPPSEIIANQVADCFQNTKLTGQKILITLGATQEAIDPVRYLSNHSSGKMGMALVDACIEAGAQVTCVYASISTPLNTKANNILALSAKTMLETVMTHIHTHSIFIAVAAVADFSLKHIATNKIKKNNQPLTLTLVENKDILQQVCQLPNKPLCIGFAAETQNLLENARKKLQNKGCDAIILNDVSDSEIGFNSKDNSVIFLSKNNQHYLGKNSKQKIAKTLVKILINEYL